MNSQFALNAVKLFVLAAISAIVVGLIGTLDSGNLPSLAEAKTMGITAITAGISYVVYKLFLNNNTVAGVEFVNSDLFSLNWHDVLKSTGLVVITAIVKTVLEIVTQGGIPTLEQFKKAALTGLIVGLSYLFKNYISNSSTKPALKEPSPANAQ